MRRAAGHLPRFKSRFYFRLTRVSVLDIILLYFLLNQKGHVGKHIVLVEILRSNLKLA